jgi:hypothetical protein
VQQQPLWQQQQQQLQWQQAQMGLTATVAPVPQDMMAPPSWQPLPGVAGALSPYNEGSYTVTLAASAFKVGRGGSRTVTLDASAFNCGLGICLLRRDLALPPQVGWLMGRTSGCCGENVHSAVWRRHQCMCLWVLPLCVSISPMSGHCQRQYMGEEGNR